MLYFLALPKQAGGQTVINDRRAVIISLPGDTDPGDARAIAAEADIQNKFSWAAATGGFLSDDSLTDFDGLIWLNSTPETPEVLEGEPGGGPAPLDPDQAIVEDGQTFPVTGGTVSVSVADNTPAFEFTPD